MEEQERPRNKRCRLNPTHRWTEAQIVDFLEVVVGCTKDKPESFEKPTAQKFYERIAANSPSLQNIIWANMKGKMCDLKSGYIFAIYWKDQTGAGDDKRNILKYINKICPHWNLLEQIFRQKKHLNALVLNPTTSSPDQLEDIQIADPISSYSFKASTSDLGQREPLPNFFSRTSSSESSSELELDTTAIPNSQSKNKSNISKLISLQEKKLELEQKKFELEQEKEKNRFELKKMELKQQLETEMLKLESQERLKKCEINLNINSK